MVLSARDYLKRRRHYWRRTKGINSNTGTDESSANNYDAEAARSLFPGEKTFDFRTPVKYLTARPPPAARTTTRHTLTVNSHRSFRLAQRVFRHAFIAPVVGRTQGPDGQHHVRLVPVFVDDQIVLRPGEYHRPGFVEQPKAYRPRIRFGHAVDGHVGAQRRAHQLIGHHQRRRNCKTGVRYRN